MKTVGIIVLVHVAIIGVCVLARWLECRFPDQNYDERQKLNRYKASSLSMFVGLIYYLWIIVILIGQVDGEKTVEPYLLVMFGILLQVTVDHTYCLLTHSALPLSQKPVVMIGSYLFCGAIQLISFFIRHDIAPLSLVGHGSGGWINLTVGISFLYLALMHTLQLLRREKE